MNNTNNIKGMNNTNNIKGMNNTTYTFDFDTMDSNEKQLFDSIKLKLRTKETLTDEERTYIKLLGDSMEKEFQNTYLYYFSRHPECSYSEWFENVWKAGK